MIRLAANETLAFIRRSGDEHRVFVNPGIVADKNKSRVDELNAHIDVHTPPHASQKKAPNQPAQPVPGCSRNVLHWKQENPGQLIENSLAPPHRRPILSREHLGRIRDRLECQSVRSMTEGLNQNLLDALEVLPPGIVLEFFERRTG